MKLIIDIDEDVYKLFTGNGQGMKVVKFNLENALKNGTPLEEELEQLKADIKEASYDRLDGFNGGQMVVDWEDIEDMFYDHISELKGE